MRRAKRLTLLIMTLPILVMAAGTVVYLARVFRESVRRLPEVVTAAASEVIDGTVTVGSVEILPSGAILNDLVISDSKPGSEKPIVSIPRARIVCSLTDLALQRTDPVASIKRIDILEPNIVLERAADGGWNIAELLRPLPPGRRLEFSAKIYVKSGRLVIRDHASNPAKPVENTLTDIDAVVDLSEMPVAKYSISGKGPPGRLGRFSLGGRYNLGSHSLNADLDLLNASASYWSAYPWPLGLNVLSGRARASVSISKPGKDQPLRYSAAVRLRDTSVRFQHIRSPVHDVSGDLDVRNGVVSMRLKGRLGTSPFFISGHVVEPKDPRLALEFVSDRMNFREVAGLTGYAGRLRKAVLPESGRVRALIFGPPRSFGVDFRAEAPSLSYLTFAGRSIIAKGAYFDGQISIREASAKAYDGVIEAKGEITLSGKPSAVLDGRVSHLKLEHIPLLKKHHLAAESTGSFQALWKPGHADIRFRGTAKGGQFHTLEFDDGAIAAEYVNGMLRVEEVSAKTLGGLVAASGEVARDGELNLQAAGADINLAAVRDMYWTATTVGRAHFAGKVTGRLTWPVFTGEVEAYRVMVSGLGVERIAGSISASRENVDLDTLVIYDYPGTVSLSGRISHPWDESPGVDMAIKADSIDLERLGGALESRGLVGGKLSGELAVAGALRDPQAKGSLRTDGGSYRGITIDSSEAQIAYEHGQLRIQEFSARSGDSSLTASGSLSKDGRIALRFGSDRLALEKVSGLFRPYALASGNTVVSGSIDGTVSLPRVELAVECENPAINGQRFKHFSGRGILAENVVTLSGFDLADAGARYLIPELSYGLDSRAIELSAEVQSGHMGKMLGLLDGSPAIRQSGDEYAHLRRFLAKVPRPFAGSVNANVSGGIQLTDDGLAPDLHIEATIADMVFGSGSIKTVQMAGSWRNGVANLEELEALDGDTNLSAAASFGPSDALVLQVDAHNLSLDTLRPWVKLPNNFSGKADVTIVAGGSIDSPSAEMYVEVVDPVIGGARFDRLRSRLTAGETRPARTEVEGARPVGSVNIDEVTLTLGDHALRASGYVPMDWRSLTVPRDGPMLLQSSLDTESLEILSAFSRIAAETGPAGAFEGSVKLGGTVQSPSLEGELAWRDGRVRLPRINSPLENINARLALAGDTLSIERFTGTSAEGGNFDISGRATLADLKPSLDLRIKTSGLGISGRNITSVYGEEIQAKFDSNLRVAGAWQSPLIAGDAAIPQGTIALPSKTSVNHEPAGPPPVNPKFDVRASLGREVRFESARLKAPLYGKLALTGSLGKPMVEGMLDISDGTILFPMREFRILPGSSITLHTGISQRPSVLVDMRAQTRMTAISSFGGRQRYTVTMVAQGPLDRLNPTFSSSPPGLSEQLIVALVTGQRQLEQILAQDGTGDIGRELSGLFSTAMMPTVFEPIERAFESALGFEEFALEMGYREPLQLTIGERLWDGVYLDYSAVLGARPDYADSRYELKLSYRFKRGLELGIQTDENSTYSILAGGKLRF